MENHVKLIIYTLFLPGRPYTGIELFVQELLTLFKWRIIKYEVYRFGARKKILSAYR